MKEEEKSQYEPVRAFSSACVTDLWRADPDFPNGVCVCAFSLSRTHQHTTFSTQAEAPRLAEDGRILFVQETNRMFWLSPGVDRRTGCGFNTSGRLSGRDLFTFSCKINKEGKKRICEPQSARTSQRLLTFDKRWKSPGNENISETLKELPTRFSSNKNKGQHFDVSCSKSVKRTRSVETLNLLQVSCLSLPDGDGQKQTKNYP